MPAPESIPQRPLVLPGDAVEVVLVRHGASAPAVPGVPFPTIPDGRGDPPLGPEGEEQARAGAARLAAERPAAIFVTSLRRTHQTAAPLARALGLQPTEVPELAEVHLGDWDAGEFRVRLHRGDPVALQALSEERWDVIPNAEGAEPFAARVAAGLRRVVAASAPGTGVVAVVHGGVIGELCRQATASRPFAFVHADNGSITRLVVGADGRLLLRSFNDTAHL